MSTPTSKQMADTELPVTLLDALKLAFEEGFEASSQGYNGEIYEDFRCDNEFKCERDIAAERLLSALSTPVPDAEGHKRGVEASTDPHTFAMEYEFRSDDGDYTPTDSDRAMIEDAICGYIAALEASGAVLCDAQPVAHVTDTGDRLDVCFEQRVSVDVVAGDLLFAALRTPKTEA